MTDPLSYERRTFYNEVRDYDASLEPWLKPSTETYPDAEQAFSEYKSKRQKPSLCQARLKTSLTFPSFTMAESQTDPLKSIFRQARDHYDLELRERKS